jgi:hypothetical protein
MRVNVRRGLFRLWVVLSSLWVILIVAVSFAPVHEEFGKAASMRIINAGSWEPDEPVECSEARGTDFRREGELCWYSLAVFRKLYPEYADLKEKDLSEKLYAKAGRPLTPIRPWGLLGEKAALALGPPIAVLIIGWAFIWALSGFLHPEPRVAQEPPKS